MRGNGRIRGFFVGIALAGLANIHPATAPPEDKAQPARPPKPDIYVETYVTGYNTVPGQTGSTRANPDNCARLYDIPKPAAPLTRAAPSAAAAQ